MNVQAETGIDTISVYCVLTAKQSYGIIQRLRAQPGCITVDWDIFRGSYDYAAWNIGQGIRLMIKKRGDSPWYLTLILHPAALLGDDRPGALYHASKRNYSAFIDAADRLLAPLELPCKVSEMAVTRVDVTANLRFEDQEYVDQYLRILKRSRILPHFHEDWFRERDKKVDDSEWANRRMTKQTCKSASVFAYDKTAQLKHLRTCFEDKEIPGATLRIECQLRRRALEKRLGKVSLSNRELLKEASDKAVKIIAWYLKRVQPEGDIVRYRKALELIGTVKSKETRERMAYLLRKVSDSRSLNAALKKLRDHYGLSKNQAARVLDKFAALGISPITLGDRTVIHRLPSIRSVLIDSSQ